MSCIEVPVPDLPELPAPLSIPPLPAFPGVTAGICCQSVSIPAWTPPISLGPLSPAILAAINAQIALLNAYTDALRVPCPRN